MNRSGLCFTAFAAIFLAAYPGSPHDNATSGDPLTPEAYSLYSAIYRSGSAELLGIAASPLPFKDSSLSCLKPSTPEEREMVKAAKNQVVGRVEWKRQFDFGRAYILIPAAETNKAIDCIQFATRSGALTECDPYVKLQYVRFLSIPIFNRDHTRALVAASRVCGGVCGDGGVFVYRKTRDGWEFEKDSFAKCHWVS
jgi:hypothetical protein